jgi:N-succinyl-L-ornithine transcarbamylase
MKATNNAYVMHCLPVRRNVELPDKLLDGKRSLIPLQAENRLYSAAIVMKKMLEAK